MRSALRYLISSLLVGALSVGLAWAGSGLVPVPKPDEVLGSTKDEGGAGQPDDDDTDTPAAGGPVSLGAGQVLAGASKVSLYPRPEDYRDEFPGARWEPDEAKCSTLSESLMANLSDMPGHLATAGSPWPENPNCLYMGGFGIGPQNPITGWESDPGLWVRSFAVSDGTDELVLTVIDAEGYFWDYKSKCVDCGVKVLSEELGAELDIDPAGIIIASTHSHAALDLIGGWGFVPDWYMAQVSDAIRESITTAVETMQPAVLETGEETARPYNKERRDTYRSAEEQQLTWLRAIATEGNSGHPNQGNPDVIATVGAYAGHPTTKGTNGGIASSDWPGVFEKRLEERFGGIGLHFMTGLGNMSASGGTQMGSQLADLVPEVGDGLQLQNTDIRATRTTWIQPTTNVPLNALGVPGFFDRKFQAVPGEVRTGKTPDTAPCVSASATSVELPSAAARIGDQFALTASPGEIFANVSNTIKDQSKAVVTMPLGQANDALGYMPQSFELNPVGQQALGFFAGGVLIVNYEDSYAIDRCVGDMVLETALSQLAGL